MAKVYDHVPGVPASSITRRLPNGSVKQNKANQLERVIALHEDVSRALIKEGMKVFQRANFRLTARQQRHRMQLKEDLANAIDAGDTEWIADANRRLLKYEAQKTHVTWSQADIDFHISLFRPDGREFYVEADSTEGDRGLEILQRSLTG